ncbi:MAG: hypothetical protein ABMA64_02250 [Myxococcota bacterium]
MDLWGWFEELVEQIGEQDPGLARRLEALPGHVVDGRHAMVDAAVPELLAAARRLGLPWLEVFVRHWRLQSWVFHRSDVARGLPEAVSLIERAHRADAAHCPQTVCASQDLCAAYGFADGPGWAPERLEVSAETLGRIDPRWPCWTCISAEHCGALLDAGRAADSLAFALRARAAMDEAGEDVSASDLSMERIESLLALGRADEALALADAALDRQKGESFERERRIERAWCLVRLGRVEEALAALPPWAEVEPEPPLYDRWAITFGAGLDAGLVPWDLEAVGRWPKMVTTLRRLGCPRPAIGVALLGVDVYLRQGARAASEALLDLARAAVPELRTPLDAPAQIEARAAAIAAIPWPAVPDDPQHALAALEAGSTRFDGVVATVARHPSLHAVALQAANEWRSRGFPGRARQLLTALAQDYPDEGAVVLALGQSLLDEEEVDALDQLLARYPDPAEPGDAPGHAAWLRSRRRSAAGDLDGAAGALEALLAAREPWCGGGVPYELGRLRRALGDLPGALEAYQLAVDKIGRPSDADWDLLVVATWLDRWDVVRAGMRRLGIPDVAGEGPVDAAFGMVRLRYDDEDAPVWAARTGPVTARVVQVCGPRRPERFGDQVVFDPAPIEAGDPPLFRVDGVKRPGGAEGYALDGAHPGAALEGVLAALAVRGWEAQVTSSDAYQLTDPDGQEVRGVYVRIAVPAGDAPALAAALTELTAGFDRPLVWFELSRTLDPELAERQLDVARAWGMI